MNINGIGATGYPAAGYETRRTERNMAGLFKQSLDGKGLLGIFERFVQTSL